jgi:LmeA-like phospholipid-binding
MAEPIVPMAEPPSSAETLVIELPPEPPKKKRRRWVGPLIAIVIVVAVLVIVFFVGDAFARQYATGLVREKIVQALKLDPTAQVDVDLGDGSILVQAAAGSIDDLGVHVSKFSLGEITGEADIIATAVPIDTTKPLGTMNIAVTVDESNVQKLSGYLSGIDLTSIELRDKLIRISTDFDLFLAKVPVAVDLAPSANQGGISFDPITVLLGDQQISVADLRAIPGVSDLAGGLLGSRTFCVAGFLPQALTIDDVKVSGTNLVVSITGDGATLGGPGLSTMGSCPAP